MTKEGGTQFGRKAVSFDCYADSQVVVRAIWLCCGKRPLPITQPARGEIKREEGHKERYRTSRSDQFGLERKDTLVRQNETSLFGRSLKLS